MKKFIRIFCIVALFFGGTYAIDLANISLDFCTTKGGTLVYHIDAGVETGICYTLTNHSDIPMRVKVGFIDGTYTNDQEQNKACLGDNDVEKFGKYVTTSGQIITLKGGETIKEEAKLLYTPGMNGLFHGCIVYSLVEDKPNVMSGFTIIMRKAKFIDVFLGKPQALQLQSSGIVLEEFTAADGENISNDPQIRIYKDISESGYIVQIKVRNVSSVEQDIVITGDISNILSYKDTFVETRKILGGELLVITKNIGEVQPYNLRIKFTINNTPFSFDTQQAPVTGIIKEEAVIGRGNVLGYMMIIAIIVFFVVTTLLVQDKKRRKKKALYHVHHMQHPHETHHPHKHSHHSHSSHDAHHTHHAPKK